MTKYIAVHHAGGFLNNPLASTKHLQLADINNAHKNRKDWIGYRAHKSSMGYYVGYTFVYDPKNRVFIQTRAIGEETLAQRGFNFNTIAIMVIGNYSKDPKTGKTVDKMTREMEQDLSQFINNLISGNHNHQIKAGNKIDLAKERVHPHRWFQTNTECYGTGLTNAWVTEILSKYKPKPVEAPPVVIEELEERIRLMQILIKLWTQFLAAKEARKIRGVKHSLGTIHDRSCVGIIET